MKLQVAPLVKGMLIYGTGDVLTKLLNFLLLPLFTAYLSPDDYGISSILALAKAVLIVIFSLGFGTSFAIVYSRSGQKSSERDAADHKSATLWTSSAVLAISAVFMSVVSILFARTIAQSLFQTPVDPYLIQLSFVTNAFTILTIPVSLYYQMEQRSAAYVAISLSGALLSIGLNILMIAVLRLGVIGWLQAGLISQGVTLLLYMLPALFRHPFRLSVPIGIDLLRLGLPLVPSFAFVFVMQQSNLFFLERFRGLAEVGIYTVGASLGAAIGLVVAAFTRAWTPYFLSYTEQQAEARALFGRITSYYVIGIGSLCLCVFIFARAVILLMTAPAFHDAYSVVGFASITQFLTGLFSVLLPAIYFASAVRSISVIQAGAAAVTLVACLIAIPLLSATGAALAAAIGTGAMCLFTLLWNRAHRSYFQVDYESGRIRRFAAFSGIVILFSLVPRDLSLSIEIVFGSLGVLALLVFDYGLLLESEKNIVGRLVKRATRLLRVRNAN